MDTTTVLEIIKMIDSEINALDRMLLKAESKTWTAQLQCLLVLKNTIECRIDDYNESQLNAEENKSTEQ